MKTTCFKREVLFAYANRMLHEREQSRVEAHLSVCAACRAAAAGYQKLGAVLGEWKPAEPSPWFDAQARARIESSSGSRPWRAWQMSGWRRWAAVAAIFALAVTTGLVALRSYRRGGQGRSARTMAVSTEAHATPPAAPPAAEASATPAPGALAPGTAAQAAAPAESASQEMNLYENLKVLENYDMLANFKVLSEMPQASDKSND